jgi:hypothetical protein
MSRQRTSSICWTQVRVTIHIDSIGDPAAVRFGSVIEKIAAIRWRRKFELRKNRNPPSVIPAKSCAIFLYQSAIHPFDEWANYAMFLALYERKKN